MDAVEPNGSHLGYVFPGKHFSGCSRGMAVNFAEEIKNCTALVGHGDQSEGNKGMMRNFPNINERYGNNKCCETFSSNYFESDELERTRVFPSHTTDTYFEAI